MNREIKFRMFEKATNLMHYENNEVIGNIYENPELLKND